MTMEATVECGQNKKTTRIKEAIREKNTPGSTATETGKI